MRQAADVSPVTNCMNGALDTHHCMPVCPDSRKSGSYANQTVGCPPEHGQDVKQQSRLW